MKAQVMTFRRMKKFTDYLFDSEDQSRKAALILKAILDPTLSRLSHKMPGRKGSELALPRQFSSIG
jgi:hypothetical protein